MIITLIIRCEPEQSHRMKRTLAFIESALQQGHSIRQCFFQGPGVRAALADSLLPRWIKIAETGETELVLCSQSVEEWQVAAHAPFVIGGLGALIEASVRADRVMSCV